MSLAVFRGKQCKKATKCKACPEYSEGKNDNKINAMLPCLPKRHAGRDTAQATTFKMLISAKLSMTTLFIISQNKTH
jgi:hypothetical protein